jgi:Tfp pilus assembly protein PilF
MAAMALIGAAVLSGCRMNPIQDVRQFFGPRGESYLNSGIRNYEEGRFAEAADNLRDAVRAGLSEPNEVIANKYLAFIACSQKRERHCRAYFRRVLEIQPNYELSALEAGHPMWGPTFRALKAPQ